MKPARRRSSSRIPGSALLAVAVVASALCTAAAAGPAEADDPLGTLLLERGLAVRTAADDPAPPIAAEPPPAGPAGRIREGAAELVVQALAFVGVRYRRGGDNAENGFDCSGFVRHVYGAGLGVELPRRADEQAGSPAAARIDRGDLRAGDLVFFNTLGRPHSHVGIYIGDDRFVHAPRSGEQVRAESMATPYWRRRYDGGRRIVGVGNAATAATAAAAVRVVARPAAAVVLSAPPDDRP